MTPAVAVQVASARGVQAASVAGVQVEGMIGVQVASVPGVQAASVGDPVQVALGTDDAVGTENEVEVVPGATCACSGVAALTWQKKWWLELKVCVG